MKVKAHEMDGRVHNWTLAWLNGREHRVQINNKKSNWGIVNTRVPHGSVLGPLLFIIYINYSDFGISSNISKFADDTKIGRQISLDRKAMVLQGELN